MNINKLHSPLLLRPYLTLFIVYAISIFSLVFYLILWRGYDPNFFLIDDGYNSIGKSFFYENSSLFHQFRPPLFPLLLSILNFFTPVFQPFVRVLLTLIFVLANTFLAQKNFESFMNKKDIFIGLAIALFNPLHIHWTLKSTPEIYLTTFIGLIIYCLIRFIRTEEWRYLLFVFALTFIATNFKPVFSLVSVPLFVVSILSRKKKLITISVFFVLFSIVTQLSVMRYSKPISETNKEYGRADLIGNYFLVPAMFEVKRFEFGSNQELLKNNPEKSVLAISIKKYAEWTNTYYLVNPNSSTFKLVFDFVRENPWKVVVAKALSPILFISLASTSIETASNLVINLTVLILSVLGIRKLFRENKKVLVIIISVLFGYYLTYFVAFSYARYSVPVLFYLSIIAGIFFSKQLIKDRLH